MRDYYEQILVYKMPKPISGKIGDANAVYEHFKNHAEWDREAMIVLYLNSQNEVLFEELHTIGGIDSSAVYPREIMKVALKKSASAIILVHNHPSGHPERSCGDKELTRDVFKIADALGIMLLDHVIIGRGRYYSFGAEGEMDQIKIEAGKIPLAPTPGAARFAKEPGAARSGRIGG